jgi:hypothetical protein
MGKSLTSPTPLTTRRAAVGENRRKRRFLARNRAGTDPRQSNGDDTMSELRELALRQFAEELVDAWDDKCTSHIDPAKLLDPTGFDRIDYDRERNKALKLGRTLRVGLGDASAVDWRIASIVKPQKVRRPDDIARAFKANNVKSFDELMAKWHGWKPVPSPDNDEVSAVK